jgi:hypothetical protein
MASLISIDSLESEEFIDIKIVEISHVWNKLQPWRFLTYVGKLGIGELGLPPLYIFVD